MIKPKTYSSRERLFGALFYAVASIVIMLVNKYVLSVWKFHAPNVLALAQFSITTTSMLILKQLGLVSFPSLSYKVATEVFPLPLLFLGNTVLGLYGTDLLSIPMFGVLRRLTLLFTLILEKFMLQIPIRFDVLMSLMIILAGSTIAVYDDLSFNLFAYFITLLNNLFTALNGVVSKQKLNKSEHHKNLTAAKDLENSKNGNGATNGNSQLPEKEECVSVKGLGTWGLMCYNSMFSIPLLMGYMYIFSAKEFVVVREFDDWSVPFVTLFIVSSFMGTILQYSIFYCTKVNSALTTSVTGCVKNVLTTYVGMVAPGMDYTYSTMNFVGVNISIIGGLYYAKIEFDNKQHKEKPKNPAEVELKLEEDSTESVSESISLIRNRSPTVENRRPSREK